MRFRNARSHPMTKAPIKKPPFFKGGLSWLETTCNLRVMIKLFFINIHNLKVMHKKEHNKNILLTLNYKVLFYNQCRCSIVATTIRTVIEKCRGVFFIFLTGERHGEVFVAPYFAF